ncbi:MAG: efflux RND transporter periplasmic adaptor subunit [Candidatus Latescibacteria bacterium]|nr:efflux RND transporter periplasmic adaptor subunit [bacterium]MBD3425363.1 efflux RND transporter periplasmic adaptor subunit [Candidatus Latescibacterota bacterium]
MRSRPCRRYGRPGIPPWRTTRFMSRGSDSRQENIMTQISNNSKPRPRFQIYLPALLALLLIFLSSGCGPDGGMENKKGRAPLVEAEEAVSKDITRSIELVGTVEAARTARIASPAQGPVLECRVREGDIVEKDRTLLTIGRRKGAEERASAARKELARQREELGKIKKLVDSGAVPGERLDEARLRVAEARARLSDAVVQIEDYKVKAPWNGEISRVVISEGHFVSPREVLVEMFDPRSLVIRFAVPEKESMKVETGQEVTLSLDAYEGREFRAEIARVYPELDRRTRTRTVEAVPEAVIDMAPGMFARLEVPVEKAVGAVVVQAGAIVVTPQEKKTVFIVEDGKATRREVGTGIELGRMVQITSGVAAGDSVIVSGNRKLQDGARVRVISSERQRDR